MAVDLEKYRKQPTTTGGSSPTIAPAVDINKYRKAPVVAGPTFDVPVDPAKASQQRLQQYQSEQGAYDKEAGKGFFSRFGKALVKNIAPSEVGLGKTIAGILYQGSKADQALQESIAQGEEAKVGLLKTIREQEAKGMDTTRLKQLYNEQEKTTAGSVKTARDLIQLPTNAQAVGQIGGTALDLLTAGTYSKAKTAAMSTGRLFSGSSPAVKTLATAAGVPELGAIAGQKAGGLFSLRGAGNIAKGASLGYATDVTAGLQGLRGEDRTGGKAFIPGLGTAIGAGLPALSEAGQTVKNIRNPEPRIMSKRTETLTTLGKKYAKVDKAIKASQRNGVDAVKVLSETNLLNGAVDDDGLLAADRALANFDEFISPYEGKVRDAIQAEGRKVSISQIANEADDFVKNSRLPGAAKDQLRAALEADMRGFLIDGDQIPVEALHDTKIFRNSHSNYTDTGATAVSKEAARFFKEQVEKNVGSLDVKNYNNELSKYYAVKDVIESLNKTRVQGGRLGKYFSSVIGTGVGGMAGGPIGAIVGAEAGSRIQGQMMSRALGGDIQQGLTPSSALINASRGVVGKKAIPDLVLPKSNKTIPDVIIGDQSSKVGNRQTSQATTMIPIKNVIDKSVPQVSPAVKSGQLTPREVNDAKIKEIFGDISPTEKKDNPIPASIVGKPKKGSQLSNELEMERIALDIKEEALKADPARELMKYISKRGDSKGTLAEVTGRQASKTGIGIDTRVADLGFKDSESARDAVNAYKAKAEALAQERQEFNAKVKEYKKSEINSLEEAAFQAKNAVNDGEMFAGAAMGFEKDEEGNINFDVEKAAMGMVGLGVASSVSRSTRAQAISKKISAATKDELAKFITVVKGKAVTTDNGRLKFKAIDGMTEKEARQAFEDGLRFLEFDTKNMDNLASATPGKIANFYEEILKVSDNKIITKTANNLTDNITKAKAEGKTFEEWVKGQPTYYHATSKQFDAFDINKSNTGHGSAKAIFVSESPDATKYYQRGDESRIVEATIAPDAKIFNYKIDKDVIEKYLQTIPEEPSADAMRRGFTESPRATKRDVIYSGNWGVIESKEFQDFLKKEGFDGFRVMDMTGNEAIGITNPSKIKTRSQLKAEWDKVK